jgi:hypothetical protein
MKLIYALLLAAMLSACATFTAETPQQKVFAAHQVYDTALSVAVTYKRLPPCGTGVAICADKAVVATIQKADNVAYEALKTAQGVVRAQASTETALQTAVRWAQEAIGAFSRVTATLQTK